MGDGNAAGHIGGLPVGEVGDVPGDLAGGQRRRHGVVVHQQVTGEVQDDDAVLHLGDGLGVYHSPGVVQQGSVEGNDVALGIDFIPVVDTDDVAVQVPRRLNGDEGVAAVDGHAQISGGVGQRAAHCAEADDAQILVANFMTGEFGLAFFHQFGDIGIVFDGLYPVDAAHHVPAAQKHTAQRQLHHGVGVGAGGVEHHDASFGAVGQGNVVDAGTGAGDGQKAFRQSHIVHVGRAHQNAVGLIPVVRDGVIVRQKGGALGGNLI